MAQPTVLVDPRAERTPIRDAPRPVVPTIRTQPSGPKAATATPEGRRTFRQIVAAAVMSVVRYASKYERYRGLGYTQDAAMRKARWHVR